MWIRPVFLPREKGLFSVDINTVPAVKHCAALVGRRLQRPQDTALALPQRVLVPVLKLLPDDGGVDLFLGEAPVSTSRFLPFTRIPTPSVMF